MIDICTAVRISKIRIDSSCSVPSLIHYFWKEVDVNSLISLNFVEAALLKLWLIRKWKVFYFTLVIIMMIPLIEYVMMFITLHYSCDVSQSIYTRSGGISRPNPIGRYVGVAPGATHHWGIIVGTTTLLCLLALQPHTQSYFQVT
jgi:hypothetical protein